MQNSYSFVVDLCNPGFSAEFKTGDGTLWAIQEHWSFLDNPGSDLVENLGHVVIMRQRNNRRRVYKKQLEAYPLERTDYTMIKKEISDSSSYWFSITYREYDEHFRPNGIGTFQRILYKLTFSPIEDTSNAEGTDSGEVLLRRNSMKKRYNYLPLQNISSNDVKSITAKTVVDFLLDAVRTKNADKQDEAIDYITKNYTVVKKTEPWRVFSVKYPELKEEILDRIIEDLCNNSDHANMVLQRTVSEWSISNDS